MQTAKEGAKVLTEAVNIAQAQPTMGLKIVPLDNCSVRIIVFADSSFASNKDLTSQLEFVIGLANKHNKANIFRYSSFK